MSGLDIFVLIVLLALPDFNGIRRVCGTDKVSSLLN